MGSEFFWFLDLLALAIFAVHIYRGATKGAVAVLISAVSAVLALIVAFSFSGMISESLYNSLIKDKVESYVENSIESAFGGGGQDTRSDIDMSKAMIKDKYLSEITMKFDATDRATLDLSSVDLSETGIGDADLSPFGLSDETDLQNVSAGTVTVMKADYEKYGIENIVLARVIAANIASEKLENSLNEIGGKLSETYAVNLKNFGKDLSAGSSDAIYSVVVALVSANAADYGEQIMEHIVSPMVLPPLRIIIFLVLFILTVTILNLIASVTKLINRIPVLGKVNGVLGAVLGFIESIIMLLILCLVMKLAITLCGNSLVFINEPTIDKTFIFRFFYALNPLTAIRF
ncbi:MAG: CvpA family protein [Ruminiclostridium sp.]|nr:CvpA family protein [Ruminiclostridium sp.]